MKDDSKRQSPRCWYQRLTRSWIINNLLLPLAIGLLCNLVADFMK